MSEIQQGDAPWLLQYYLDGINDELHKRFSPFFFLNIPLVTYRHP